MPYFNRAACIYDTLWIILIEAVIIAPPIRVAAVNDSRSISFTCLSPTGQNEGGIASIQWLLNGVFLEDLSLNNVNSSFAPWWIWNSDLLESTTRPKLHICLMQC